MVLGALYAVRRSVGAREFVAMVSKCADKSVQCCSVHELEMRGSLLVRWCLVQARSDRKIEGGWCEGVRCDDARYAVRRSIGGRTLGAMELGARVS